MVFPQASPGGWHSQIVASDASNAGPRYVQVNPDHGSKMYEGLAVAVARFKPEPQRSIEPHASL